MSGVEEPEEQSAAYFLKPESGSDNAINIAELDLSSNALWIIENVTPSYAGPLKSNTPYRLKHFATSAYLLLQSTGMPRKFNWRCKGRCGVLLVSSAKKPQWSFLKWTHPTNTWEL